MAKPSFDKPIDTWIEEEVEIPVFTPTFDKDGELSGITHTTRKATQKTIYSYAPETPISCKSGDHSWHIPDPHIHEARCHNCRKVRFIRAVYEKVTDGKILDRQTNQLID